MRENRESWLSITFDKEGGYVDDPDDTPTNMGVTLQTLRDAREDPDLTAEDVKNLSQEEAREIYCSMYWSVCEGDKLPGGVDILVGDIAVLQGPRRAAKMLQAIVGTKVDGYIADKTITALRGKKPIDVLLALHNARMDHLTTLKRKWPKYGAGWTKRCAEVLDFARTKVVPSQAMAEVAKNRGLWGALAASAAGLSNLVPWLVENAEPLSRALPGLIDGLPTMLETSEPSVRRAIEAVRDAQAAPEGTPQVVTIAVMLVGSLYAGWRSWRNWRSGKR